MFRFNLPRKPLLKRVLLVSICVLVMLSCGSGEIQNFEGIAIHADPRVDRIDLRIYLVDRNGTPLIWNQSILSPSVRCEYHL